MLPSAAKKKQPPELSRLQSVADMAVERFGQSEGLAIVTKTTIELSQFYAKKYALDVADPEVTLHTTALAFARHKEFTLLREIEYDLFKRVAGSADQTTYGQVLFNATRTGAYRDVYREVDRLHGRASNYLKELRELAREQAQRDA